MSNSSDPLPDKSFLDYTQERENIFKNVENITETFKVMNSFRESNIFCDILLITDDGKEISAHKVVLGSASTVLLSMFMDEKKKNDFVIPIKDIDGDILEIIVKYMYTFKLDLSFNDQNIEKVLRAANFFDLNNVKNLCCDFIENNINLENCLYFMKCAELFSFKRLYDLSFAYTLKHFLKIKTSILNDLACENIIMLISSNNLETESEEQVYNLVLEWVKFAFENRKEFIPELMKHVRWPFLSTDILFKALNEPLMKTHNECLFLLVEATMIHCVHSKRLSSLTLNSLSTRSKRRLPLINKFDVIVSISHDKDEENGWYLDISDPNSEWEDVPSNLIPPNMYSRIIALDNGILMSIGGKKNNEDVTNDVFMLDISNYWLNWIQIAPTNFNRTYFAVCTDQKCVYVIGGINDNSETLDSIEYFDVDTKQWNLLGNMKTPRSHCSAIYHNKIIYIIGGRGADDESSTSVECYDVSINNWIQICHPLPKLNSTSVTILNNVLYVIGINPSAESGKYCLDTVLYSFDLHNGEWECLEFIEPSQKGMVNGKQLYIVDGHILDYDKIVRNCYHHKESLDQMLFNKVHTTEVYGVENNKWHIHQISGDVPYASNIFLWSKNLVS